MFAGKTSDSVHLIADLVRCLCIVLLAHPLLPIDLSGPLLQTKMAAGLRKRAYVTNTRSLNSGGE